jgi:hypothetical protein
MKKIMKIWVLLAIVGGALISCSTPNADRSDYFGFNNKPVIEPERVADDSYSNFKSSRQNNDDQIIVAEKQWINPLTEEYTESTPSVAYTNYYPAQVYVPVVVPWWDYYYRPYVHYNYYPRSWFYLSWHYDPFWDDYYSWRWHQPYIGHRWCWNNHYDYPWHHYSHSYYDYPVAKRENKYRNFGSNRGNYIAAGSTSGTPSIIESRRSARTDFRNDNIQRTQIDKKQFNNQSETRSSSRKDNGNSYNPNASGNMNIPKSDVPVNSGSNRGTSRGNDRVTPPSGNSNPAPNSNETTKPNNDRGNSRKQESMNVQSNSNWDTKRKSESNRFNSNEYSAPKKESSRNYEKAREAIRIYTPSESKSSRSDSPSNYKSSPSNSGSSSSSSSKPSSSSGSSSSGSSSGSSSRGSSRNK